MDDKDKIGFVNAAYIVPPLPEGLAHAGDNTHHEQNKRKVAAYHHKEHKEPAGISDEPDYILEITSATVGS